MVKIIIGKRTTTARLIKTKRQERCSVLYVRALLLFLLLLHRVYQHNQLPLLHLLHLLLPSIRRKRFSLDKHPHCQCPHLLGGKIKREKHLVQAQHRCLKEMNSSIRLILHEATITRHTVLTIVLISLITVNRDRVNKMIRRRKKTN